MKNKNSVSSVPSVVHFDELRQSQIPAVELLINLGYSYLSQEELKKLRYEDDSRYILKDIAFDNLKRINKLAEGEFSESQIIEAIDELENIPVQGLQDTAREVYTMLMSEGGKTFPVFIRGKKRSLNFRFIDFEDISNNAFHIAVEVPVKGKRNNIRPDIICYINGIPFVVIENKKSSVSVQEGVKQMVRNQGVDYAPKLFVYVQILLAINTQTCLYATTGTPQNFYASWQEKADEKVFTKEVSKLIAKPIDSQTYKDLCKDLRRKTKIRQVVERQVTQQDKTLYALLRPERLLLLSRSFMLFDAGVKKIARYQQFFAVSYLLNSIEKVEQDNQKQRQGGLIWHTQGSGKSITMILFVKALIEHKNVINPRILIVTDRKDLDRQIKGDFANCKLNKEVTQAKNGKHLIELIKKKSLAVITSTVHKFESVKGNFVDQDKNIFVLIDESHRTQYGTASEQMRKILPNACFIGFTGTPLLRKDKSKNKFRRFIDTYTIDDALNDNVVLPLVYQARYTELSQNKEKVDRHINRLKKNWTKTQRRELQKFINQKIILSNPQRITEIAYDIDEHYRDQYQGTGLKAQLVAPSKYSAILFQQFFDLEGRINTKVVISEEQAHDNEDPDWQKKEVAQFLAEIREKYSSLEKYESQIIESFKHNPESGIDGGVEILIVVDKLLTGFDAPPNSILYLTKDLKEHNLLQAIARVNRVYDNKKKPKTAGLIVDYSKNAQNIKTAMELFGSYDLKDVKNTLIDSDKKIGELEESFAELNNYFKTVNTQDNEAYFSFLNDKQNGEQRRRHFYKLFNNFLRNLDECYCLPDFSRNFEPLDNYKKSLKHYTQLRKSIKVRFADKEDLSSYKRQIEKILAGQISAQQVQVLTSEVDIHNEEEFNKTIDEMGTDKSKAEAIASQLKRIITEKTKEDPKFYKRFSKKIQKILDEMHEAKISDAQALNEMKKTSEQIKNKEDDSLPKELEKTKIASIFYRNLISLFKKCKFTQEQSIEVVKQMTQILKQAITIDWHTSIDKQREIRNLLDDYLYDEVKEKFAPNLSNEKVEEIINQVISLAIENHNNL